MAKKRHVGQLGNFTPLEKFAKSHPLPQTLKENLHFDASNITLLRKDKKDRITGEWPILAALVSTHLEFNMTGASALELVCEDPEYSLLNDPFFKDWMLTKKHISPTKVVRQGKKLERELAELQESQGGEEDEEEPGTEYRWELPEDRAIDLNLDGIWFRLSGFKLAETKLTFMFEDRAAAVLREEVGKVFKKPRSSYMTRARFIHELVKEAQRNHDDRSFKLGFFCPEEGIHQPTIEEVNEEEQPSVTTGPTNTTEKELKNTDGITVKGQPANASQLKILNEALLEAVRLHSTFTAKVALVEAIIDESDADNSNVGSEGAIGFLQILPSNVPSLVKDPHNVPEVSGHFLTAGFGNAGGANEISRKEPHLSAGEVAHKVQANAESGEATYGRFKTEAEKAVKVFGGTTEGGVSTASSSATAYEFMRGPFQTSWDCIQGLAREVGWYAFIRENTLWYVSGDYLYDQASVMPVERGKAGVDWVEPHIEIGARNKIAEINVKARAATWVAFPGMVVHVTRVGPANGKWLVDQASLDILDEAGDLTVKLQKPLPPKREREHGSAGANSGTAATGAGNYVDPFKNINNLTPERIDMGVDFAGSGQIVALGDATIEWATNNGAWPGGGWVSYKLENGEYQGKIVYHAEHIKVLVSVGQKVKAGDPVAELYEGYPNSESGWAIPGHGETTLAASLGQQAPGDPGGWESAAGASFNRLLVKLGCPSGVKQSGGAHGTMPSGYP